MDSLKNKGGFVIIKSIRHYKINGTLCCNKKRKSKPDNTTHETDCKRCFSKINSKHQQLKIW